MILQNDSVEICVHDKKLLFPFLAVDMSGSHSMIICSEEQFKVLSLPQLRIKHKEKLTAIDGSKVRKLGVISLRNQQGSRVFLCPILFISLLGKFDQSGIAFTSSGGRN